MRVLRRAGERVSVCISVFADLFLWAFLVCLCSLMCAYMCRADITPLWQSSQNHSLTHMCSAPFVISSLSYSRCDRRAKSLLSWAQLSPFGKEWTQWVLILSRDVLRYVIFFFTKLCVSFLSFKKRQITKGKKIEWDFEGHFVQTSALISQNTVPLLESYFHCVCGFFLTLTCKNYTTFMSTQIQLQISYSPVTAVLHL